MTIEIKQLIIRAVVTERRSEQIPVKAGSRSQPGRETARTSVSLPPSAPVDRDQVIAECTRQVLRALRRGRER